MTFRPHPDPENSATVAYVNGYDDFDDIYTKGDYHRIMRGDTLIRITSGGRCIWQYGDYLFTARYQNRPLKAELKQREGISDWDTKVSLE